jgi:hypothetical protein
MLATDPAINAKPLLQSSVMNLTFMQETGVVNGSQEETDMNRN